MLSGDNGILNKATDAKINTEKAQIIENAQTDILAQQTDNKGANITKEQLATILNKYFKATETTSIPDEVSSEDGHDLELETKDEKYKINLSKIFKGRFASENVVETFGEKYEDNMIGKTIQYTSGTNNITDWIILGKQVNEQGKNDILITTKNPVSTQQINRTLVEWAGYETKIKNACKTYVGETGTLGSKSATIKEVRNITLADINTAVGFNGTINSVTISNENGGFAYPNSNYSGWIKSGDEGYESWTWATEPEHAISKDDARLENAENMKYIVANNTGYWIASRSVDVRN